MRRIMPIAAVAAMLLLYAVGATTAFAEENTKILPMPTQMNPVRIRGISGVTRILLVGGGVVECESDVFVDTWTSYNLGTFVKLLTNCKGPLNSVCTTLGSGAGLIEVKGEVHFLLALAGGSLVGARAELNPMFQFTCSISVIKETVTQEAGCDAGLANNLNELLTKVSFTFKESKGVSSITEILLPEAKELTKCTSEAKIGSGSLESDAMEGTEESTSIEQGEKEITVLLMNPQGL